MALSNDEAYNRTIEVSLMYQTGIESVLDKLQKQQHQSVDTMFHDLLGLDFEKISKKGLQEILNICKEQVLEHIAFDLDLARGFLDDWREEKVKAAEKKYHPTKQKPN